MRKILLLLTVLSSLLYSSIDERKTDVYFFLVPKLQLGNAYNNKQDN